MARGSTKRIYGGKRIVTKARTKVTVRTPELEAKEQAAEKELSSLSNWGRWGPEDERGAANNVDIAAIKRALAAVKVDKMYSLGYEINSKTDLMSEGRPPNQLFMVMDQGDYAAGAGSKQGGGFRPQRGIFGTLATAPVLRVADEYLMMAAHAQQGHIDALSHMWTGDRMYNGWPASNVRSSGASRLGIEKLGGIITRGILLDFAKFRNVERCDGRDYFTDEDVIACCELEGVTIEKGDAVFCHTGFSRLGNDPDEPQGPHPQLGESALLYIVKRDICAIQKPTGGGRRWPKPSPKDEPDPWEDLRPRVNLLWTMGIYTFSASTSELARDKVYEFLLSLAPLLIVGATASPINPLALA